MGATYLVDGYNLLHAMGLLGGRVGPHGLEKARARFLGLLHGSFGDKASTVTVVFDARHAPPNVDKEQHYRGVHVVFAMGGQEADDVIEKLVGLASAPKSLHVVSDDHRIQQTARRRRCVVLGCEEFLTELERRRKESRRAQETSEKIEKLSEQETRRWLKEFGAE
jgi:predicted RNA-binding protein with PIN domain